MNKETHAIEKTPLILSLFIGLLILLLHFAYLFTDFQHPIIRKMMLTFSQMGLFSFHFKAHLWALLMGSLYAFGIKTPPSEDLTWKHVLCYFSFGIALFLGSFFTLALPHTMRIPVYIVSTLLGYILILTSLIFCKRMVWHNLMQDQFNQSNKRFEQEKRKLENAYSVNIPTQDGWLNIINPFRATMVLGTPGSGKSYTIVEEFIRQHIQKGFSMLVYDFKYPDLSQVAYNAYLKYHQAYPIRPTIYMVNFHDPKNSHRINPIAPHLLASPSDALAAAESLFLNINKEFIKRKDFFTASAVNLLAAIIWFLRLYQKGQYCTIPHAIALLNVPDTELFLTLSTKEEVKALLSPFQDALAKEAYQQLAGQTASARIPISRFSTKPLFWILSGTDMDVQINAPQHPSLLFLANHPQSQGSYSAIYGLIASTLVRVVNQKDRLPLSLIIDELPTIYIHGLDQLIATARSNKISTLLSFQDLAQLERDYGKEVANAIFNTIGNKITGSVVAETAKKLSEMIGKSIQKRGNITYSTRGTSMGTSTTLDYLIPPETIAQLSQGEFCGVLADTFEQQLVQKRFYSRLNINKKGLGKKPIPPIRQMDDIDFEAQMTANYQRIYEEVAAIVAAAQKEVHQTQMTHHKEKKRVLKKVV